MTKNILVVDQNGNKCGTTYRKRAKGLVKKGRARFISENKICLIVPQEQTTEWQEEKAVSGFLPDMEANMADYENPIEQQPEEMYTIPYILKQLEKIAFEADYLKNVVNDISQIGKGEDTDSEANAAKAEALKSVVLCRETTYQQMIAFYNKMYDDLKPKPETTEQRALNLIENLTTANIARDEKELLLKSIENIV